MAKHVFETIRAYEGDSITESIPASALFPTLACDTESKIFLNDDGTMGVAYICSPLVGADENAQSRVEAVLQQEFPNGSLLQFFWFRSPDIERYIEAAKTLRFGKEAKAMSIFNQRMEFIEELSYTKIPMGREGGRVYSHGAPLHDQKLLISLKVPYRGEEPTQEYIDDLLNIADKLRGSLKAANLNPYQIDGEYFVRFMMTLFNWGKNASWRNSPNSLYDPSIPISDQIVDFENPIEIGDTIKLGEKHLNMLSVKRFPDSMFFGDALGYTGDLLGNNLGIDQNYFVACSIYYPDSQEKRGWIESRRRAITFQAHGPLLKYVPILADKHEGFYELYKSLEAGARPVQIALQVGVFADTPKEASDALSSAVSFFRSRHITVMNEELIGLLALKNALPFGVTEDNVRQLWRHKTMTTTQANVILPIFSEWKGTGSAYVNLFSRNGQIMNVSLHDSDASNGVIIAPTGSGKSFFANELITSYLSMNTQVWIIDAGRSYEDLCSMLDGTFISFEEGSNVCLNPFDIIEDFNDEAEMLTGIVGTMISSSKLTDLQRKTLKRIITNVWHAHGKNMTIDHIAQELIAFRFEDDETGKQQSHRINDMGYQLEPFTSKGDYGKYFIGKNNVNMGGDFVVLEIDELKTKPDLQQVVLLQLIYQIQQEIYLGDRSIDRKKMLLIDEAWSMLKNETVAQFMEDAYRRFRKYKASAVIVTQLLMDIFGSTAGRVISANADTKFVLRPDSTDISAAVAAGALPMSQGAIEMLKTTTTIKGSYSEIYVLNKYSQGIGRLIVSPFQVLLYSTDPDDVGAIARYKKQGMKSVDAINQVMKDRGYI